jgi:hypothetical protein
MSLLNLGMHIVGENKKPQLPKMRDPDRIFIKNRIENLQLPQEIVEELLRRLNGYPDGALKSYWNNLGDVIETLKLQRAKDEI